MNWLQTWIPMWLDELTGRLFFSSEVVALLCLVILFGLAIRAIVRRIRRWSTTEMRMITRQQAREIWPDAAACHHDAEWMHRLANEVRDAASDKPKEP